MQGGFDRDKWVHEILRFNQSSLVGVMVGRDQLWSCVLSLQSHPPEGPRVTPCVCLVLGSVLPPAQGHPPSPCCWEGAGMCLSA